MPSAACDVARRWPPHALADCECIQVAETGKSEKRFGDGALEAGWIKVSTLIKKHEPENLKDEVTEPQQKAKEALTSGNRLTFARFDQIKDSRARQREHRFLSTLARREREREKFRGR